MNYGGFAIRTGVRLVLDILGKRRCLRAAVILLALAGGSAAARPVAAPVDTSVNNASVNDTSGNNTSVNDMSINDTSASDTLATDTSAAQRSSSGLVDTVSYESDAVDYDNENRILNLYGRARVRYQNIVLEADTIIYDVDKNQFQARGRPQLVEGRDTTVGDAMVYNIKTRRGRVTYSTVRFDDTYFTGANIVKTETNCLFIASGDYTTCENPDHPHYFFYGEQLKIVPEDMAVGRPVILNIGDAPIAILPFFAIPLQRGRRSGWLTPSWGGSLTSGGYLDNLGYYYAPNDYCDFTLSARVQEFNSLVINAGGRYALRYSLDGSVSGRYAFDNRLGEGMASQQWALDYRHNQNLAPDGRTTLRGSGSILSNRSFNQLYSDETRVLEQQQLDANMALSHKFESINATSSVVWRRNHNLTTDRILEDMPSVDFNLNNRAILPYDAAKRDDPAWYNNIYYSYRAKANMRRDVFGNDSLPGFTRPGMENNLDLNSSQKLFRYFNVAPYFNLRSSIFYGGFDTTARTDTVYTRMEYFTSDTLNDLRGFEYETESITFHENRIENGDLVTYYRVVRRSPSRRQIVHDTLPDKFYPVTSWRTGVNLSTRVYGLFPVNLFGVTAVRHTLTPTIGYAYVPKHDLDKKFYDVRIGYDTPRSKAQQLMNVSLANTFQGKRVVRETRPAGGALRNRPGTNENLTTDTIGDPIINDTLTSGEKISPDANEISTDSAAAPPKPAPVREEKFDILSLSISTAYDFEAESRAWRDVSLNASTSLNILRISFNSNFWMYDETDRQTMPIIRDYNVSLTSGSLGLSGLLWDGDLLSVDTAFYADVRTPQRGRNTDAQGWSLSFSPGFNYRASRFAPSERFTPVKSFNLSGSANLNVTNALSVQWNGNYDFTSNQFSHNNYTFYYDLECWEMRFTWRPEKINPGFHFVVNVKKIPDIKWENKESRTTR